MIPTHASDLAKMIVESERQRAEVEGVLAALSAEQALWRPNEQKWSVLGHVVHLCLLNELYVEAMQACVTRSREAGRLSDGPYRHPWFGRWFTNAMEPPPKRRMKTAKAMIPDPELDGSEVGPKFARVQGTLAQLMEDTRGVDLGRARFSSPFACFVRLSLGTGLSVVLAHNRRHVWLAGEVMDWDGFPEKGDRKGGGAALPPTR